MGAWLAKNGKVPGPNSTNGNKDSIVLAAYEKNVPIFCPAFSDCSAGFGLVAHQHARQGKPMVSIDSAKDFYEITKIKIANPTTGLLMIGGGVPKNFAQDIVVAADILGVEAPMHKYAVQITVADARDGALSGSTLKEASSWGKVDLTYEQMVYAEATLASATHRRILIPQEGQRCSQRTEVGEHPRSGAGNRLIAKVICLSQAAKGRLRQEDGPSLVRHNPNEMLI